MSKENIELNSKFRKRVNSVAGFDLLRPSFLVSGYYVRKLGKKSLTSRRSRKRNGRKRERRRERERERERQRKREREREWRRGQWIRPPSERFQFRIRSVRRAQIS